MDITVLLLVGAVIAHLVIHAKSTKPQRNKRLIQALCITGAALPLLIIGLLIGLGGNYEMRHVAFFLTYAPSYMPLLSFVVYIWRRDRA